MLYLRRTYFKVLGFLSASRMVLSTAWQMSISLKAWVTNKTKLLFLWIVISGSFSKSDLILARIVKILGMSLVGSSCLWNERTRIPYS